MTRARVLRTIAIGSFIALSALALITLRAVIDGEREMRESDAAFDKGDLGAATLHARSAAILYAPGAPHVRRAYERLEAIAIGAESAGQRKTAENAWRAIRSAALETRHVVVVHGSELSKADDNLARLSATSPELTDAGDQKLALERARKELARDDAPNAVWLGVLIAGFAAAAIGLGWVGVRGVAPSGALTLGRAKMGIVLTVIGAACWTVAVWRA